MRCSTNNSLAGSPQNMSSAYKTAVELTAATATLTTAKVYDALFGTDGTPADNAVDVDISRATTIGTGTAATPVPLDPAARAAGIVGTVNHTAEPTYTASSSLLYVGLNQRASYRWVAAPGSELIIPATNLAGVGLRLKSAGYTSTFTGQLYHEE